MSYRAIVEYWCDRQQRSIIEVVRKETLRKAQDHCRYRLKALDRRYLTRIPECARVEDADENVMSRYRWDSHTGKAIMVRPDLECGFPECETCGRPIVFGRTHVCEL